MRHLGMCLSMVRLAGQTVSSTPQRGAMLAATVQVLPSRRDVSGCLLLGLLLCSDSSPRHSTCSHGATLTLC